MSDNDVKSGSGDVQYFTGLDYSGLASLDASINPMPGQALPDDFNMGAESLQVGAMTDASQGLQQSFNDGIVVPSQEDLGLENALGLPGEPMQSQFGASDFNDLETLDIGKG